MSAFIVSDYHINYLLNWANRQRYFSIKIGPTDYRGDDSKSLESLGNLLKRANYQSVNTRYNQKDVPEPFKLEWLLSTKIDPVQVIKACDCFDYQACEVPDYERTDAAKVIDRIRSGAWHALPGYEEAEWEIGEKQKV